MGLFLSLFFFFSFSLDRRGFLNRPDIRPNILTFFCLVGSFNALTLPWCRALARSSLEGKPSGMVFQRRLAALSWQHNAVFFFFFKLSTRKLDALGHRKESKQLSILPPPEKKKRPFNCTAPAVIPRSPMPLVSSGWPTPEKTRTQTDRHSRDFPFINTTRSDQHLFITTAAWNPGTSLYFIYLFFFHFSYTSTSLISALFLSPQTHTLMLSEMHRVAHTHAGLETTVLLFDSSFSQRACFRGLYQCLLYSSCSTRTRLLFFFEGGHRFCPPVWESLPICKHWARGKTPSFVALSALVRDANLCRASTFLLIIIHLSIAERSLLILDPLFIKLKMCTTVCRVCSQRT